jgi:pentatricopeptide repeat protein
MSRDKDNINDSINDAPNSVPDVAELQARYLELQVKIEAIAARERAAVKDQPEQWQSLRAELELCRKDQLDLKDRFVSLKDQELIPLKEKAIETTARIKMASWIGSIIAIVIGLVGVKTYSDFADLVNKTFTVKFEQKLSYYDKLLRAINYANTDCARAIPLLADLLQIDQDDELTIMNLFNCYIEVGDPDGGYRLYKMMKDRGSFNRFQLLLTFNNAGSIVLSKAMGQPELMSEAFSLLRRAEQIAYIDDSSDVRYPLYNLLIYYIAAGDIGKAAIYARNLKEKLGDDDFRTLLNESGIRTDKALIRGLASRVEAVKQRGLKVFVLDLLKS